MATGSEVFTIGPLLGTVAGAPALSSDNRYLFANHHDHSVPISHFTVWEIDEARPIYAYDRFGSPFSPLGSYWNPIQGYFDGGLENTNDVYIWSLDLGDSNEDPDGGLIFAFQFPSSSDETGSVQVVGNTRQFRSPFAPVITNHGLNMYMAISRNDVRCWAGETDLRRYAFHTGGIGRVDFPRNEIVSSAAPPAPPTVSEFTGVVYGPTATGEIYRLNANCTQNVTMPTDQAVVSKVLVGPESVYYATLAPGAALYQLNPDTLETIWQFPLDRGVAADMALSSDGKTLFLSDVAGLVHAITIAEPLGPTTAPLPTFPAPTTSPTAAPTVSFAPTPEPTISRAPTLSPKPTLTVTASPTLSPVVPPPITTIDPDSVSASRMHWMLPAVCAVAAQLFLL